MNAEEHPLVIRLMYGCKGGLVLVHVTAGVMYGNV